MSSLFIAAASAEPKGDVTAKYRQETVVGWTLKVHPKLLADQPEQTQQAISLLKKQLTELTKKIPAEPLKQLRTVTLYFSPKYPQSRPRAEYHPGRGWLEQNGRNPEMVQCVEFSNIGIFERESRRMPNFALHELAHAFHHQFLPGGFGNSDVKAAFDRAVASGRFQRVERRDGDGNTRFDQHYAITNPQEYFAETTEAFFSKNDFYPYDRAQLQRFDPEAIGLMEKLWRIQTTKPSTK